MKAHINGITIEGTPQEIMEYQRMREAEARKKPIQPAFEQAEVHRQVAEAQRKLGSGSTTGNNSDYCTVKTKQNVSSTPL